MGWLMVWLQVLYLMIWTNADYLDGMTNGVITGSVIDDIN